MTNATVWEAFACRREMFGADTGKLENDMDQDSWIVDLSEHLCFVNGAIMPLCLLSHCRCFEQCLRAVGVHDHRLSHTQTTANRGRKTDTKMDQISTAAMSSLLADTLRAATNAAGLARMLASNFASAKQDVANDSMQARQLNFDSDVVSPIETISSPSDLVEEPFLNAPTRGAAGTPGGKSWLELQWDLLQALGREARRLVRARLSMRAWCATPASDVYPAIPG
eukprot:1956462-Rhodomonas_salina.3